MSSWQAVNPNYQQRVRTVLKDQPLVQTLDVEILEIGPGLVRLSMPFRKELTQQHGYLHAGMITALADNACGCAALSLMAADRDVLAVEFKVNFLSPAIGDSFEAVAKVVKPGRTLTICTATVYAHEQAANKPIACMQATMISVPNQK